MSVTLVVRTAFGPFVVGEGITDPGQVQAILSGPYAACVDDGSGIVVIPVQPNGLTHVSGPPAASLAASYGFALDDDAHVLYQWIGTLWSPILAGSPSGAVQVSGSAPASAGAHATVSADRTIVGVAPASAGASATPSEVDALSGAAPASAGASATVTTSAPSVSPSGTAPASAGASGTVSVNDNLVGTAPKSAGASGTISAVDAVSGAAPASAGASGSISAVDAISGAAPTSAGASATVTTTKARSFNRYIAFGMLGAAKAA